MEKYGNSVETVTTEPLDDSELGVDVDSVIGMPAADFRVRVDDELMLVTAVVGSTLTVTRGIEGTTAASHADGATVTVVVTAATFTQVQADRFASGPFASRPTAGQAGRLYRATDGPYLYRDTGIAWEALGPMMKEFVAPPTTGWSGEDYTALGNALYISAATGTDVTDIKYLVRTVTAPYVITASFTPNIYGCLASTGYVSTAGLCWRESSTDKFHLVGLTLYLDTYRYSKFVVDYAATYDTDVVNRLTLNPRTLMNNTLWMKLEDDETDRIVYLSSDGGYTWVPIYTAGRTTDLTPDQAGLYIDARDQLTGNIILNSWEVD